MWTYQLIEAYDRTYHRVFTAVEEQVRQGLAAGRRHLAEAGIQQAARARHRRRTAPYGPRLAAALLEDQGQCGPVCWSTAESGHQVNDGGYSYRNPANRFALPTDRLARVTAALAL
ncbi:hypothetical protein ACFU7Y_37410 [Kitasatospora sp. NPDC057542]|uniref:hypothetical protein n=1 Tax=Streptomycetaceae TaxID=2062 RepID=UPI001CCA83FB|nr:hypothetical protein [Streptomyces sp. LS1784]